jgi:hypothetical protein
VFMVCFLRQKVHVLNFCFSIWFFCTIIFTFDNGHQLGTEGTTLSNPGVLQQGIPMDPCPQTIMVLVSKWIESIPDLV